MSQALQDAPTSVVEVRWEATSSFRATVDRSEWEAMDEDERDSFLADLEQDDDTFHGTTRELE